MKGSLSVQKILAPGELYVDSVICMLILWVCSSEDEDEVRVALVDASTESYGTLSYRVEAFLDAGYASLPEG